MNDNSFPAPITTNGHQVHTPSTTNSDSSPIDTLIPDCTLTPTRGRHGAVYSSPSISHYVTQLNLSPPKLPSSPRMHQAHSMNEISLNRRKPKLRKGSSLRNIKRSMSRDNLLNTARSLQSASSKAMLKMKHSDSLYTADPLAVAQSKAHLSSISSMNKMTSAAKKLHKMQSKRLRLMQEFSSTIHSTIDLGRKDENYFGQYVKMMASTMHCVSQLYSEYNDNLHKYVIEALQQFTMDEDGDIQQCINLKHEYNRQRNVFNNKRSPSSKHRLELEDAQQTFVCQTNELIQLRHERVTCELQRFFEQSLPQYARNKAQYIENKRLMNGYDEMKERTRATQQQINNDMIHIKDGDKCISSYMASHHASIVFFHRNKFPPSMKFLMECVAPLSKQYHQIQFIIVHHTCHDLLQLYHINVFPTCLVFVDERVSQQYPQIIGNSQSTRDQLHFICKQISDNCDKADSK